MGGEEGQWSRRIYERHLDLLLAEELECRPAFAHWLLEQSNSHGRLPDELPVACVVTISNVDAAVDPLAAGEDDLSVELRWADGTVGRLLIEDKLDAVLQPRQGERYALRIAAHSSEVDVAGAVVVAPESYLAGHRDELAGFASVSIEQIVEELRKSADGAIDEVARRLRWRADRLITFKAAARTSAPDDPHTIAVRDLLVSRLVGLYEAIEPQVSSMRTVNTTWLYFTWPAGLIYKITHGWADLYLRDVWPDDEGRQHVAHERGDGPKGFEAATDSVGNLVFRCTVHGPVKIGEIELGGSHAEALGRGVDACVNAAHWVREVAG